MSAIAHSCPSCGSGLPVGARFCAACGARTAAIGRPVNWSTSERRYFGVVPARSLVIRARLRLRRWFAIARSSLRYAVAVVVSRSGAAAERLRLQREQSRLEQERSRHLHALGVAVYRNEREETAHIRSRIGELDRRMEAIRADLQRSERRANEQIAQARLEDGRTNLVEPEPIPEPMPVPSEPPGPVIVPEPEPVPHEQPGPVIVPEPQPPTDS
jgi:zinc ribbon protein